MSWDFYAQDFPDVPTVAAIPDDFVPRPLGPRDDVIARIKAAIPAADFSDPSWGVIVHKDWSIEINIGNDAICDGFALYVRGGGETAMDCVATILQATGARAVDMQTSEFFERKTASDSFGVWQSYRDDVVAEVRKPKPAFFARLFGR